MFGFQSKRKLQERVYDLIETATIDRDLANKTEYFDQFVSYYDEILDCFKEICEIANKIRLQGISGNPKEDYIRLKNERQWHMRDALERHYHRIVKENKTVYRNNRNKKEFGCRYFLELIDEYSHDFDDETLDFANKLSRNLFSMFGLPFQSETCENNTIDGHYDFDCLDGFEFECWCANLLRCNGFVNVEVTNQSGDHGVDIVAEKDDIHYAIQCKCYASDVGNTPVQEVYAGKNMYHCQIGVVMTNRYFTKGARELAESTGVLLWNRDKILSMINCAN